MANWRRNTVTVSGDGTETIVSFNNGNLQPIEHPTSPGPWMVYVDVAPLVGGNWEGISGLNLYHTDAPVKMDETGAVKIWCETKWQPPIEAFAILSQRYPNLT